MAIKAVVINDKIRQRSVQRSTTNGGWMDGRTDGRARKKEGFDEAEDRWSRTIRLARLIIL